MNLIIREKLKQHRYRWCITGVAGFIGSNLLEFLLQSDQKVVGLDNFSTGFQANLDEVKRNVLDKQWKNFTLIKNDICKMEVCEKAVQGVDFVLHQAALGSVPYSIERPDVAHLVNVDGFLNILTASRNAKVKRFIFASSSAVYGDDETSPKVEEKLGNLLSPYATTKYIDELYASVFSKCYNIDYIGLRYFNVFGKRQNPEGPYAAVIPRWIEALVNNKKVVIYGDGEISRDFVYIEDVLQANLLAALIENDTVVNQIYNIACGKMVDLNMLFDVLKEILSSNNVENIIDEPIYEGFKQGDIRHSLADISKAKKLLGYYPAYELNDGLEKYIQWFIGKNKRFIK